MQNLFGEETVRSLGLYQPFAAAMLYGKVETRWVGKSKSGKWRTPPFPLGKYLIYSCQMEYTEDAVIHLCTESQVELMETLALDDDHFFEYGSGICIGDMVRIIDPLTSDVAKTFVRHSAPTEERRRVGLVFENVKRIKPFYFKGKQGVGILTEEEKRKIEFV